MVRRIILETSFLIDLERERRGEPGPATRALEREADSGLYITFTVAGELAVGTRLSERDTWLQFLAPLHVLPSTIDVCWQYGVIYRHLAQVGQLIGTNDLWIAATALAYEMAVLTRNVRRFHRVPNLEVVEY